MTRHLSGLAFAAAFVLTALPSIAASSPKIVVVDGDTIYWGKSKVRLVGFDTPEIHAGPTGYQCDAELQLGLQAKAKLSEMLAPPNVITVRWSKGRDKYGRSLGRLYSNHKDVGPTLIGLGLAHPYNGHTKKLGWC